MTTRGMREIESDIKKRKYFQIENITISDAQRLAAKEVEDKSFHFHSEDKGCEIMDSANYTDRSGTFKKCLTHDVMLCRCGWQVRHHYGIFNRGRF